MKYGLCNLNNFGAQSVKNVHGLITYIGIEIFSTIFGHVSFKGYNIWSK